MQRSFEELFRGGGKTFYKFVPSKKTSASGKVVSQSDPKAFPGFPTPEEFEVHRLGTDYSLIVAPNLPDRTTLFGVIDIDPATADDKGPHVARELLQQFSNLGLPFAVTESKSQGAHAWVFFREPEQQSEVLRFLEHIATSMNLMAKFRCNHIDLRPTKEGAGIQIPYWGETRMMPRLDEDEGYYTRDEFVEYINDHCTVDLMEFRRAVQAKFGDVKGRVRDTHRAPSYDDLADQGPPCYEKLMEPGAVGDGFRNTALSHMCVKMSKMFPDDWEEIITQAAYTFDPPYPRRETEQVIASFRRHGFQLMCDNTAIKPFCNRELCKLRKFGIMDQIQTVEELDFTITKIIRWMQPGEENVNEYVLHIYFDGHEGYINGNEKTWVDANQFMLAYFHKYGRWPHVGKQKDFMKMIEGIRGQLGVKYFEIETPWEHSETGVFEAAVVKFVLGRLHKDTKWDAMTLERGHVLWLPDSKELIIPAQQLADELVMSLKDKTKVKRASLVPTLLATRLSRAGTFPTMGKFRAGLKTFNVIRLSPKFVGDGETYENPSDAWFTPPENAPKPVFE